MGNYKDPDFQERKDTAAAAKKALLQKFLAAADNPRIAQRQAERHILGPSIFWLTICQ